MAYSTYNHQSHSQMLPWMNNNDPTSEFRYQIKPPQGAQQQQQLATHSELDGSEIDMMDGRTRVDRGGYDGTGNGIGIGHGDLGGGGGTPGSQPIDLKALNARLQTLGLNASSSTLPPSLDAATAGQPQPPPPTAPTVQSQARDSRISALNADLRNESNHHHHHHHTSPALGSAFRTNPVLPRRNLSHGQDFNRDGNVHRGGGFFSPSNQSNASFARKPGTHVELGPSDSLSQMYRPYHNQHQSLRGAGAGAGAGMGVGQAGHGQNLGLGATPESIRSGHTRGTRRGGTNVDPVDGHLAAYPEDEYDDENRSAWETRGPPISDAGDLEAMTLGRTDWGGETVNPNMAAMRSRLLATQEQEQAAQLESLNQHIVDASQLAKALTKLESTEEQLRSLQANLIAERVARTQIERNVQDGEGDLKDIKNELAAAVRALRRAREEGKRNEEERKRLARCFEDTKVQLYRYHEELKVRDARAKGREEGRAEAWQEAERWMGGDPPIPVDPVNSVPNAVLRHTPMPGSQALPGVNDGLGVGASAARPQNQQGQNNNMNNISSPLEQPWSTLPNQGSQVNAVPGAGGQSFGQAMQPQYQQQPNQQHLQPHSIPAHNLSTSAPNMDQPDPPSRVMPSMGQAPQSNMGSGYQGLGATLQPQHTGHGGQALQQQHTGQGNMNNMGAMGVVPGMIAQPIPVALQPVGIPVAMQQGAGDMSNMGHHPSMHAAGGGSGGGGAPLARAHTTSAGAHNTPGRSTQGLSAPGGHQNQHRRTQTLGSTSLHPAQTGLPPQAQHAADSYLDRVDHDPKLRSILAGAPSKTIHTSHYAGSEQQPMTAQSLNKPLPAPGGVPADGLSRSQTHHGAGAGGRSSRAPTAVSGAHTGYTGNGNTNGRGRRNSLMSGIHAHSHIHSNLNEGDRYPAFPHQQNQHLGGAGGGGYRKGHSRHSSYDTIDPAGIALPKSNAGSAYPTPHSHARPLGSAKHTPNTRSTRRSKVAGALRGDTDFEGELSDIQEDDQEAFKRSIQAHNAHPFNVPPEHAQAATGMVPPPDPGRPSYAPSMPPMRARPTPRMPIPLGGKAGSESHAFGPGPGPGSGARHVSNPTYSTPRQNRTQSQSQSQGGGLDPTAHLNSRLPDPPISDKPVHAHDLYVPPGMAPMAVHGSVHDVGGPRTSALGLEGMDEQAQHRTRSRSGTIGGGSVHGVGAAHGQGQGQGQRSRAPTSSRSRSGPNTQLNTPLSPPVHTDPRGRRDAVDLDKVATPKSRYGNVHSENVHPPLPPKATSARVPHHAANEAYHIPLPAPRHDAPTVYSGFSPDRYTNKSLGSISSPHHQHHEQHTSRSNNVTNNDNKSSKHAGLGQPRKMPPPRTPEVNVIDYALQRPLPDSRPTTAFSFAPARSQRPDSRTDQHASVVTISDPEAPARPVSYQQHGENIEPKSQQRGRDAQRVHGHHSSGDERPSAARTRDRDPRMVPLPVSRAGTHRRGPSTYAGTVAPIEEVTEDESWKGARSRSRGR